MQALVLPRTLIPTYFNTQPLNLILPHIIVNPWSAQVGHLNLGANLDPLPKEARDVLPKVNSDGKKSIDEHWNALNNACGVLVVLIGCNIIYIDFD